MKTIYLKLLSTAFALLLITKSLFAQGTYVIIHAGYGLNMASQNMDFYNHTGLSTTFTDEQVNVSLGKGFNAGFSFGYMFNKNIGAELGVSYLSGGKSRSKDIYTGGTTDYTLSAKMLRINPAVVISSGAEKINPYAKFGLIVGSGSILNEYHDDYTGDILESKMKLNGGTAFGLNAGLGVSIRLSDRAAFFTEINTVNLSYAPTTGKYIEYSHNGVDLLPGMKTDEKEIDFVKSFTYDTNNPPLDSQPKQMLKNKYPFGSVGLNFGLRFRF